MKANVKGGAMGNLFLIAFINFEILKKTILTNIFENQCAYGS